MSDVDVPKEERAAVAEVAPADLGRARLVNLAGLVSPVANLGMRAISPPELRWFGVGAGVVLWAFAAWSWRYGSAAVSTGAVAAHYALVLAGLVNPRFPELPGRLWIRFGESLGRFMAYPIFALLYFLVVTPTALLVRACGKDPLERNAPPGASYWRRRKPTGPERFERQF